MRSAAVFRAQDMIGNKFELCQATSKTVRFLQGSTQDTQRFIALAFNKIAIGPVTEVLPPPSPELL